MARKTRRRAGPRKKAAPPRRAPKTRKARRGPIAATLKWVATAAVWLVIAATALVTWYATDLPDVDAALAATRRPTVTLLAADGSVLATRGDLYGMPVRVRDLPASLPAAVLATEDRRFYDHFGLDVFGLARAAIANLRAGRIVQGGSTITQQVAKNLFLSPERTLKRKVQEVLLALWLERRLTKDQILTVYLNRVYLGAGTYGVDAAARRYFGRPATEVSLYESAMLAGLLKAPSRYNPARDPDRAARRTERVLAGMVEAGVLSEAEAKAARSTRGAAVVRHRRSGRHFTDWVLEQVTAYISPGDADTVVTTTLDPALQRMAEATVRETLAGPGRKAGASEAALVALSPDGAVRAMVGGRDYGTSQFNRAVQALRQPGSAFKPVVYLAGLESGLAPGTRLTDAPLTIDDWSPRNFSGRHEGPTTVRDALARSVNTVAVRVSERAGRRQVIDTARRLGLTSPLTARPSLALGASEVALIELTGVYAVFANGGYGVWPYGIEAIHGADGRLLYRRTGAGPGRVVAPRYVAAMNDMLAGVLSAGTGRAAALTRPAAGKTGTSQNFRDAWFLGYSADLVCGVWVGNDDGRPMRDVTGGGLPARMWRNFMAAAHDGLPARPLPDGGSIPVPADQEGFWDRLVGWLGGDEG